MGKGVRNGKHVQRRKKGSLLWKEMVELVVQHSECNPSSPPPPDCMLKNGENGQFKNIKWAKSMGGSLFILAFELTHSSQKPKHVCGQQHGQGGSGWAPCVCQGGVQGSECQVKVRLTGGRAVSGLEGTESIRELGGKSLSEKQREPELRQTVGWR